MNQYKETANTTNGNIAAIDLTDLFKKIFYHWPLYLFIIGLSVIGGFIYLRYARPNYMSSAKLYLKDEKKGQGEEADIMKSLSIFNSGKNIENEMELIKSPILVEKVVRDKQFNVRYYQKGNIRTQELYEDLPLKLQFISDSSKTGTYIFDITVSSADMKITHVDKHGPDSVFFAKPGVPFKVGKETMQISFNPKNMPDKGGVYRIKIDSIQLFAYDKIEDINTALVNKEATVVMVTYEDPIPGKTADFLNALLDTYNEYTLDDKNRVALKTIRFLNGRIDSLKDELGFLERQEEHFKVTRGITDIEGSAKLALDQVKDADVKLNEANMQLSIFDQVDNYINNPGADYPFAPLMGNVDQTLTAMINRYEELLKEKNKLSLSLQPSSIIVQNLDKQINDAKGTIREYISGYRRNAGVAQNRMQAKVNQINAKIANIPSYEREYINIKRQQTVKENLYLHLLKKKEEAAVSYASNVTDNKVIAPAFIPTKPITPNKTLVFVSFIAGGLLLATGYLYAKYFLNNKVLSKKDIEQVSPSPLIAEVFEYKEDLNELMQHRSVLQEQIFSLRTNLRFLMTDPSIPNIIQITSSVSGEGKTFITAHLGKALTANNKKVVLLELDLRKPKLSKFFGLDNQVGITNFIIDSKSTDEIIKRVPGVDNLSIVSSGPIPPNPIELIESKRMAALINSLKEKFDYIIIDTAPIGVVSDAKSLAAYADCTLFVVRYKYTLKGKMAAVLDILRESYFKKTGVIFNGIAQNTVHTYQYYYQYSYSENKMRESWFKILLRQMKQRLA